jgi:hypothetical protein
MSSTGGFSSTRISAIGGDPKENSYIWTTEKINQLIDDINNGVKDIRKLGMSPFKDNDINLRRENLPFEYTPEEIEELSKCKASVMYFALNYCVITTPKGRLILKDAGGLRDFQEQILKAYKENPLNILMASRQTGKTVTSAIFMLWFLLFHPEKTALCVADNFTTTKELIDKFRIALEGLPFFMKPGIDTINQSNVKFDSNSRLVGRTTTKKSGIGLTVNLLYIDEFAHINEANLDEFYRAIFPTVTADPNGKIIITSTPNGKNKFWEIWKDAVNKKSSFYPLRVDWWQIAGRDEEWKKKKIADLGSVEDFNQEYGLQFYSSDKLLLNSRDLKKLDIIKQEYVNCNIILDEELSKFNEFIFFHKKYENWTVDDFKSDPSNYVFSIDTADGIGGDYSVLNIYKVIALPVKDLLRKKEIIKNEVDTISLVQVGYLRSNQIDINEFTIACEHIIYNIFNTDQTRIVLELNHKGDILLNQFKENDRYWPGQIIHTLHTQAAQTLKPGLRLGPTNKIKYCEKFKYLVTINRVIPNDEFTVSELGSFGKSKGGMYRGQNGNDDLAITSVNLSSLFESSQFWEIAVETYERAGDEYAREVDEKIFSLNRGDGKNSMFDFDEIRRMNETKNQGPGPSGKKHVFDLDTLDRIEKIKNRFFKS